jgi:uroporphyrinogen decarboxylase
LLKNLRSETTSRVPIWFMRQAGRYLPEYMKIRKDFESFIEFCLTPEAAAAVTLQPVRRFDIDAAIMFADILIVPYAMGIDVQFQKGHGPILKTVSSFNELHSLEENNEEVFSKIGQTIKIVKQNMPEKPLIGFAGSPWTVACYVLEGQGSKEFLQAKKALYGNKTFFDALIEKITDNTIKYLTAQIEAGVDVIKLFDSWSGVLDTESFQRYVIAPTRRIADAIRTKYQTPIIGFPRGAGVLYSGYAKYSGVDCVALDQKTPLQWARQNLSNKVLQGNFDNTLLAYGERSHISDMAGEILGEMRGEPFIFNLSHGMLPETPIENVEWLIEAIRKAE